MGQEYSRPMGAGGRKLTRTKRMGLSCPNSTTWPRSARPAQRVPGVNLGGYRLALRPRGRPAPPLPRAYDIGTNMAVALDRLHDEVETSTGLLMMFVGIYEELNTDRIEALERLQAGDFDGMDEEAMTDALVSLALFPAFSPPEGVYNEIVTSGMLSGLVSHCYLWQH